MSRETESALTPEEWRLRGTFSGGKLLDRPEHWDGDYPSPALFLTADGALCAEEAGVYHSGYELDARKAMALGNLSLTLEQKPGAITMADVDICTSAAWYFGRMAKNEKRDAVAVHLRGAQELARDLAGRLRALVPPAG